MRTPGRLSILALLALLPAIADAAPRTKKKSKRGGKAAKAVEPDPEPAPTPDPVVTPTDPSKPSVTPATVPIPSSPAAGSPATPTPGASTSTTPGASPPSEPKPAGSSDAAASEPDVDTLRQEYLALRDELFKSRARASTVASALYSTRVQVKLTYTTGRFYNPAKATIRLDGASVYENATGAIAADDGIRFDGYVAPGRHVLTFRVEATGKDDDTFTSVTETQIVVKAVPGKDLIVAAKAKDTGDIAYEWKRKEQGSYGLGIDVSVKTQARADGGKK